LRIIQTERIKPKRGNAVEINDRLRKMTSTIVAWTVCFTLYCGLLLIEDIFFGGDMKVGLYSFFAGAVVLAGALILFFTLKTTKMLSFIACTATQLVFIGVGSYLHELHFYFFMMLLLVGIVSLVKNFKIMASYIALNITITVLMFIFLVPRLEWLDNFRFFMQFVMFLYGSLFMLIQTFNVTQKETRAEQALSSFSSLLLNTPNYMVIIDSNKRVRYISQQMAEFTHFSRQEFAVGQPLIDLFSDKALKLMFADILDSNGFVETIMTINSGGRERHFKVIADKLSGDTEGMFIDISDISPMIESKKSAEDAQLRAEAANNSKSRFLANMSHEIRTPLNAVIGIAQIEMQDESLSDKHMAAFEKIHSSGNTLLGIINDILDMSKIETGKMELNPVEYDVPSFIHDTIQLNIVRIGSKPIEFSLSVDENLPSRLFGDEIRLKQILNNLLSNAIKYTDKGQVHLSVNCQIDNEDVTLVFSVSDTGQGMKEEDREKLFSEFVRLNSGTNRAIEGTGLGLSITKKLIEMMNGNISVESEYGKGSAFNVTVKQQSVKSPPIGAELAQRLINFKFTSRNQNRQVITRELMPYGSVMVVDDVDTNLYVARGLLLPYKLEIELANSGLTAIKKLESGKKFDVVFMDHMMPQMDGIETTKRIRESGYTGIIVALTANALAGNDEMFARNGFDGFIPKPIDIRQLNTLLNKFVRDRHPEEAVKYKPETVESKDTAALDAIDPKVKQIFRADAGKAIITMKETISGGNLKLFTITAHAMKSALANVGEQDASKSAAALENAGLQGDRDFISANMERFIETLEDLIVKFTEAADETGNVDVTHPDVSDHDEPDQDLSEDASYLKEQLLIVKTACENYDDDVAYAALDRLKEKTWRKETSGMLEQIRDMLFIYSDFDGAAKQIDKALSE